jgi:competence protein ComEC
MTLVYLTTGWLLGIVLASHFQPSLSLLAALAPLPVVGLVLRRHDPHHRLVAGAVLCTLLGAARYTVAVPTFDSNHISTYAGARAIVLEGVVATEPDVRDRYVNLRVAARRLQTDDAWRDVHGLVLVQVPRYPAREYGDVLRLTGDLETPPVLDDFDYRAYLARQGVHVQLRWPDADVIATGKGRPWMHAIYALKQRAHTVVNAVFPEPEASLLSGILLGIEHGIPAEVWQAFVDTNTAHVIVISG